MGTKHLSDTLSYLDDIQPHLLTMLYAGVGSGKNHFINQLITGHTDKQITLESPHGIRTYYPRSVACTNAFIERFLQYIYHPQDVMTHLWELFDLIVIDEAHSLVMDASYQSAPFYVNELIREFCARHKAAEEDPEHHKAPLCKNMLLMTGSVAPMSRPH